MLNHVFSLLTEFRYPVSSHKSLIPIDIRNWHANCNTGQCMRRVRTYLGQKELNVKTRNWTHVATIAVSALLFVGFAIVVGTAFGGLHL